MSVENEVHDRMAAPLSESVLERYVAELDERGYVVIPPDVACPDGLADRLLDAILDVAERRRGVRPDMRTGATHANYDSGVGALAFHGTQDSPIGDLLQSLIFEGPVFETALMNPIVLAMATHMCGDDAVLSSLGSMIKGPGRTPLALHADTSMPTPLPSYSVVANCTYALTDYTLAGGALAMVPGSHRWCRNPTAAEAKIDGVGANPLVEVVECKAGSLVCWHGNTWHGAFARESPGLRVNLIAYFARPFMRTQEDLIGNIPQDMLDRNPQPFAVLTQQGIGSGYRNADDALARGARALAYRRAAVTTERQSRS